MIYEFAYDNIIMLMLCYFVETILRAVVCSNFVSRVMLLRGLKQKRVKIFKIVYYSVVLLMILSLLVLSLIEKVSLTCETAIYSYHWFILDSIDVIQSVVILISARKLRRYMQEQLLMHSGNNNFSSQID